MRALVYALAVVSLTCLSGCYRAVGIDVRERADGRISINASAGLIERVFGGRICLYAVTISDHQDGEPWSAENDVWVIGQQGRDVCRSTFTFPEVPEGFELVVGDGVQLRSGVQYPVEASGPGIATSNTFVKR